MHDVDQHGSRQRSNKPFGSRSASPLRGAAPYPKPYSQSHYHYRQPSPSSTRTNRNTAHQTPSSAWQQLVVGASSAAGTTAAVVSEESMKCMKYCLNWLQYAMQHIEQQMGLIRAFLVSLATSQSTSTSSDSLSVPNGPSPSVISAVKKDVVDTLRKVVDIISRYAGSSLPYHAKMAVRGFILNLPGRWASLNDIRSTTTSPAASPMLSASSSSTTATNASKRSMDGREMHHSELPKHEETALRLLNFGQESVEMLGSISDVFSGTVDRAELWLDRLRLRPPEHIVDDPSIQLPPIHTLDPNLYQRQPSASPSFSSSSTNNNHLDHLATGDIPPIQQHQQQMDLMN
ncbi:transcription factor Opi1-domain-containing protein [Absidia repens]|uniref:Transcription factor Opi1-domain-containing protein n=1 Tax=Absidia repens TaxID=90262 RepID=A0A1X2I9P2_9FUNG|nr:transcription factor Opi1-domain-containing protein [Absidia repens]